MNEFGEQPQREPAQNRWPRASVPAGLVQAQRPAPTELENSSWSQARADSAVETAATKAPSSPARAPSHPNGLCKRRGESAQADPSTVHSAGFARNPTL